MTFDLSKRVAIVTGAGNGLGRSHAFALAACGARVVVNDLGGARDGTGGSTAAAEEVAKTIIDNGGDAIANGANVTDVDQVEAMVKMATERWGRVDILINNAGILRDKTFAKMTLDDFRAVVDVHLMGSVICTKAVWSLMQEQQYGRVVMTTSSSGLYGNFGQSNYGAAKLALVGLMNTLGLEGQKYDIRVNALAPIAATRMTEDVIPDKKLFDLLTPESVSVGLMTLVHDEAPNRTILCAGAENYATAHIMESDSIHLPGEQQRPEMILNRWDEVIDKSNMAELQYGGEQTERFLAKIAASSEK
jgi:NAD(P)-dependent dehydrogenase (short-subunit alcohol dehydrogenase family)